MTEIEQKLLEELETLDIEGAKEREFYAKTVRDTMTNFHKQLSILTETQNKSLILLETLSTQQLEIIELLKKPSKPDNLIEQLNSSLQVFFDTLEINLKDSNEALIEQIKHSLEQL